MNETQTSIYFSYAYGAVSIIYFHNLFVSINHYRKSRVDVSVLKIIFNLSGTFLLFSLFLLDLTSNNVTINACRGLLYYHSFTDFVFRESLALILIWRLKRITYLKLDLFICGFLLLIRTGFQITFTLATLIHLNEAGHISEDICFVDISSSLTFGQATLGTDFLIDLFVTIRTVRILTKGTRNADKINSLTGQTRSNRELYRAVIRWSYLRLFAVFMFYIATMSLFIPGLIYNIAFFNCRVVSLIALTYLVTMDKEIVKVISGTSNDYHETGKVRIVYDYKVEDTKYSISIKKNSSRITALLNNDVELDINIVQSKQKLTFVEWASIIGWDIQGIKDMISEEPSRSSRSISVEIDDE